MKLSNLELAETFIVIIDLLNCFTLLVWHIWWDIKSVEFQGQFYDA